MSLHAGDVPTEEMDALARRLDDVCEWSEASKVLNHSSWLDVLICIKSRWPEHYKEMVWWMEEGGL